MCIIVDGMTDFQQRIGGFFHQLDSGEKFTSDFNDLTGS